MFYVALGVAQASVWRMGCSLEPVGELWRLFGRTARGEDASAGVIAVR